MSRKLDSGTAAEHLIGQLMDQRLALMTDVARHKWQCKTAIEDSVREQSIIDSRQREAAAQGLPARWAEAFFRAQIEAGKQLQREQFVLWERADSAPAGNALDLKTIIRPRLDKIDAQLLGALAMAWPLMEDPVARQRLAAALQTRLTVRSLKAAALAVEPFLRTQLTEQ